MATSKINRILENKKKEAITIATELWYPDAVIKKLKKAQSEIEILNILTSARRNMR